jgi:hypothetical protein
LVLHFQVPEVIEVQQILEAIETWQRCLGPGRIRVRWTYLSVSLKHYDLLKELCYRRLLVLQLLLQLLGIRDYPLRSFLQLEKLGLGPNKLLLAVLYHGMVQLALFHQEALVVGHLAL